MDITVHRRLDSDGGATTWVDGVAESRGDAAGRDVDIPRAGRGDAAGQTILLIYFL